MTAIGFCGGGHCGPEYPARLQARGAALVVAEMRELMAAMARWYEPSGAGFGELGFADKIYACDFGIKLIL